MRCAPARDCLPDVRFEGELGRPVNFEALKKDDEFVNLLSHLIRLRFQGTGIYEKVINETNKVISAIEIELSDQ